jgi:hypothetical protein
VKYYSNDQIKSKITKLLDKEALKENAKRKCNELLFKGSSNLEFKTNRKIG